MKAVEIKGIIPPIITPMNDDESINVPSSVPRSTARFRAVSTPCSASAPTARATS